MIIDKETNTVYFSDFLRSKDEYKTTFERIKTILDKHQIKYKFLLETKDIWCRDYMPIQIETDDIRLHNPPQFLEDRLSMIESDLALFEGKTQSEVLAIINN